MADFLEYVGIKVTATVDALRWSTKACLARVTMDEIELTPHYDTRARFLALVNHERAIFETEVIVYFLKHPILKAKLSVMIL